MRVSRQVSPSLLIALLLVFTANFAVAAYAAAATIVQRQTINLTNIGETGTPSVSVSEMLTFEQFDPSRAIDGRLMSAEFSLENVNVSGTLTQEIPPATLFDYFVPMLAQVTNFGAISLSPMDDGRATTAALLRSPSSRIAELPALGGTVFDNVDLFGASVSASALQSELANLFTGTGTVDFMAIASIGGLTANASILAELMTFTGEAVLTYTFVPIPEPTAGSLLAFGLLGLAWMRRRHPR